LKTSRRWPVALEAALAATLGAVQTLAYANTEAWALPIVTLFVLVWRLDGAGPRRAALLGWSYGTFWIAAGTWWLYISMHRYGGLPAVLTVAAVLVLAGALSLYLAAACAAYARWRRGSARDVALFAALCLLAELARGVIFTGFPWLAVGYSQVDAPLAMLAPWLGVYGMGAVLAVAAAALWRLLRTRGRGWGPALTIPALLLAAHLAPEEFTRPAGVMTVALLQTNVSQDDKFAADRMPEALAWTARELLVARADLVLAPETAVPLLPAQLDDFAPGYLATLRKRFSQPGSVALVGVPLGDFDHGYTNSVMGLSAAPEYRYDKTHLVPFGEFIPTGFHWFTEMMNIPLGDFARGVANPPSFVAAGQRVAPNICYEDLFGEELARRFIVPALAPTVFANISNIAWFGPSAINAQHLNISRMRTLEFQRPMIRATNTGATAIIDFRGRVLAQLPPYTRDVLQGQVQGREGITPFAWWAARLGLWPLWLGAALTVLACARLKTCSGRGRPPDDADDRHTRRLSDSSGFGR
jgi:apolipoprotein N-acyltransferase